MQHWVPSEAWETAFVSTDFAMPTPTATASRKHLMEGGNRF